MSLKYWNCSLPLCISHYISGEKSSRGLRVLCLKSELRNFVTRSELVSFGYTGWFQIALYLPCISLFQLLGQKLSNLSWCFSLKENTNRIIHVCGVCQKNCVFCGNSYCNRSERAGLTVWMFGLFKGQFKLLWLLVHTYVNVCFSGWILDAVIHISMEIRDLQDTSSCCLLLSEICQ